jgi:hypothetical protein
MLVQRARAADPTLDRPRYVNAQGAKIDKKIFAEGRIPVRPQDADRLTVIETFASRRKKFVVTRQGAHLLLQHLTFPGAQ